MFGTRRRIGTPRHTAPGKKNLFRKHNEGHSIYTHSSLPPIIQDALSDNLSAKPFGILNSFRGGTCGFVLNAQLFIWNIKTDVNHTTDVLILDLPDPDCFVSFTGNSSGVFSCTSSGTIQFWPSFSKSNTFNIDLPLNNDVTVTSLECDEHFCWIGTSDGKYFHLSLKKKDKNTPNLELLRNVGKNKGVLGRMFSWGWSSQQTSPIIKIHSFETGTNQYNTICLNSTGVEIWNSNSGSDELQLEIPLQANLEEQVKSTIQILDCYKFKKSIYVLFQSTGKKKGLYIVQIYNALSRSDKMEIKKARSFKIPDQIQKGDFDALFCKLVITSAGAVVITTPNLIIATEVPMKKEPLITNHLPIGIGLMNENLPHVITTREILTIDITQVIHKAIRPQIAPDSLTQRFNDYIHENRVEEFAKTEDKKELGMLVTRFSENILDDISTDSENSNSVLLLHQRLDEKNEKHLRFIEFLSLSKTFDYLPSPAKYKLLSHMEKMEAAMTLYESINKLDDQTGLIREAIDRCNEYRRQSNNRPSEGYTREDIFFSQVSKIEQILYCIPLESWIDNNPKNTGIYIFEANLIFLSVLSAPWKKRQRFCEKLKIDGLDYATGLWNFSNELRNVVLTQNSEYTGRYITSLINSNAKHALNDLCEQLQELDEFILDTYQFELENAEMLSKDAKMKIENDFQSAKELLILKGPFLKYDIDLAKDLAEKYQDFNTITKICDQTEKFPRNILQLNPYLEKYKNSQFPDFVFKYFCDQGRYSELLCDQLNLVIPSSSVNGKNALSNFLEPHSDLSWIQGFRVDDFFDSSIALLQEAHKEDSNIDRRATLLGLSKLSLLASDDNDFRENQRTHDLSIDHARYLNDYQRINDPNEKIPQHPNYFIEKAINNDNFVEAFEICIQTQMLRPQEEYQECLFKLWAFCFANVNWFELANKWLLDEVNENHLEQAISTSPIVELCYSPVTDGYFNSDLIGIVAADYFEKCKLRTNDEELLKRLERILHVLVARLNSQR